jgi:flagellar biogenesis protein FliO
MCCQYRRAALALWAAAIAMPLYADTAGPPDWADAGSSIYLGMKQSASAEEREAPSPSASGASSEVASRPAAPPPIADSAVRPAVDQSAASPPAGRDARRLGRPRTIAHDSHSRDGDDPTKPRAAVPRKLVEFGLPAQSTYTMASALAIVIGVFLLFAWVVRRGGRRNAVPLPADVVSVLGRVPLAARQFAELLRVGNKLVLVSLTASGAEPLTEVTDPVEVDRLVGLCQQCNPHSTTKAFEQVFRQLSREAAPSDFLGNDSLPGFSPAAAAYRAHRGETGRG